MMLADEMLFYRMLQHNSELKKARFICPSSTDAGFDMIIKESHLSAPLSLFFLLGFYL